MHSVKYSKEPLHYFGAPTSNIAELMCVRSCIAGSTALCQLVLGIKFVVAMFCLFFKTMHVEETSESVFGSNVKDAIDRYRML